MPSKARDRSSPTSSELSSAAAAYAEVGWPVLPLRVRGKEPVTPNGVYDATTDADKVRRWWADGKPYNVGLAVPEGCVVLDVDPRDGGVATFTALSAKAGPLSETLTAETGRGDGGRHLWFRTRLQPNEVRTPGPGLDAKRKGGYVVAPPSVHPDSGEPYRWQAEGVAVAVLPPSWERLLRRPAPRRVLTTVTDPLAARDLAWWWATVLRHTAEGGRNQQLFVSAARLADAGALSAEAEELLTVTALEVGLEPYEVDRTLRSAKEQP